MAKLKKQHKTFIVRQLACFEPPYEIINKLKKEFSVSASQSQVAYYNPESKQGELELAPKWRHLFQETRDKFLEGAIQIPIAHKQYRLKQLQKIYEKLYDTGKYLEACKVLEQAAKEMGGAFNTPAMIAAIQNKEDGDINFYQKVIGRIDDMKLLENGEKKD